MVAAKIKDLAKKLLAEKDFENILKLIEDFNQPQCRRRARDELMAFVGVVPKRPLYYVVANIIHLPDFGTRDIIRYLGDYIDQIVRFTLEEKNFLSRWSKRPLGPNIIKLKKYIDNDLYECLCLFNLIYTQAKHDFNHYKDESLFDYKDAIYVIFITKRLANRLLPLSEKARDYNNSGKTLYKYDPVE
ncbi:MAG: hypothetical protein WC465_00190 [Patescibacteria group bacterium]